MSNRAHNRRIVPGLLLLLLIAVVWVSLALEAPSPSAPEGTAETIGSEPERALAPSATSFDPFVGEVPLGFGEIELLPAVIEALGGGNCDIDDPFSTCQ